MKNKVFIFLVFFSVILSIYNIRYFNKSSNKLGEFRTDSSYSTNKDINIIKNNLNYNGSKLPSRLWLEYSMDIVRHNQPAPAEAARFYAYVTSVYSDVIDKTGDPKEASQATKEIINQIYPDESKDTNAFYSKYIKENANLSSVSKSILESYKNREESDGKHNTNWDKVIPYGEGKWTKTNKDPLTPEAGNWKRWIITTDFQVPPPPELNSENDRSELQRVINAVKNRDYQKNQLINFWAGTPGTETPAGIWLNLMYDEEKQDIYSDRELANRQKILSRGLADAFMECWKVKYIYWTARPSMRIPDLAISLPNPSFPSYVSGHSTVSRAAAEILSAYYPEKRGKWIKYAEDARDSRLYAGIHFDVDNREGFILGEKVGKEVASKSGI